MNSINAIYALQVAGDVPLTILHVYEHALIRSLCGFIASRGHNPAILCDLNGETFRHAIFIYDESMDRSAADLLAEYFRSRPAITINDLERALIEISAEERSKITIFDYGQVCRLLEELNYTDLCWLNDLTKPGYTPISDDPDGDKSIVRVEPAMAEFKTVVLNFKLSTPTPDDLLIGTNLVQIVPAWLDLALAKLGGHIDCHVVEGDDRQIILGADYTIPKSTERTKMKGIVRRWMDSDLASFRCDIARYIERPYHPRGITYDYLTTGLLSSNHLKNMVLTVDKFIDAWHHLTIDSIDELPATPVDLTMPIR